MSRPLRLNLAMLMAGLGSFSLLYCPQPLMPLLASHFAISPASSSLAVALTSAPMAIGILAGSVLSDRVHRRTLMASSLFLAAVLTLITSLTSDWHILLGLRVLTGLALAGVPAVAMAHISAETDSVSIGSAMGVYIAGTGVGGLLGRLGASFAADLLDWRWAFALTGLSGILIAVAFALLLPTSRVAQEFRAARPAEILGDFQRLMKDRVLGFLYLEAFIFMGVFLTVFNYTGFHLAEPPFALSQAAIGSIFILFLIGSAASPGIGWLSGRLGRDKVFRASLVILLAGVIVTLSMSTWIYILGLILVIVGFFGAHAVASSWVGVRAAAAAGKAAALYLFFYHLGSAAVSSLGGLAWQGGGWPLVVGYAASLCLLALAATFAVRREAGPMRTTVAGHTS